MSCHLQICIKYAKIDLVLIHLLCRSDDGSKDPLAHLHAAPFEAVLLTVGNGANRITRLARLQHFLRADEEANALIPVMQDAPSRRVTLKRTLRATPCTKNNSLSPRKKVRIPLAPHTISIEGERDTADCGLWNNGNEPRCPRRIDRGTTTPFNLQSEISDHQSPGSCPLGTRTNKSSVPTGGPTRALPAHSPIILILPSDVPAAACKSVRASMETGEKAVDSAASKAYYQTRGGADCKARVG